MIQIEEMKKGQAYIRIIPDSIQDNSEKDWSFTNRIMIFDDMSKTGNPIMHYQSETILTRHFGNEPKEITCTQGWVPAEIIWYGPKTDMRAWVGKRIIQIQPILITPSARMRLMATPYIEKQFVTTYMNNPVKLLSATKYHLVVEEDGGRQVILDQRYTNIESWALYEKMK